MISIDECGMNNPQASSSYIVPTAMTQRTYFRPLVGTVFSSLGLTA